MLICFLSSLIDENLDHYSMLLFFIVTMCSVCVGWIAMYAHIEARRCKASSSILLAPLSHDCSLTRNPNSFAIVNNSPPGNK